MKRLFSVLMLMLVLVLASGGSLSGHDRSIGPGGPTVETPTGDDHPWGGDQISIGTWTTDRNIGKDRSPEIGFMRSMVVRIVSWYLLGNVELQTTSQSTVVVTRDPVDTGSRPGTSRSSTTNQQGDQR